MWIFFKENSFIYLYYTGDRYFLCHLSISFFYTLFKSFSNFLIGLLHICWMICVRVWWSAQERRAASSMTGVPRSTELGVATVTSPRTRTPYPPLVTRSTWTTRHLVRSPPTRLCLFYFTSRIELVLSHPTLSYVALFDF